MVLRTRGLILSVSLVALGVSCRPPSNTEETSRRPAPVEVVEMPIVIDLIEAAAAAVNKRPLRTQVYPIEGSWTVANAAKVVVENGALAITPEGDKPVRIHLAGGFNATRQGALELRYDVTEGSTCRVQWRSDLEPAYREEVAVETSISAGAPQTATVVLAESPYWRGTISELTVIPSEVAEPIILRYLAMQSRVWSDAQEVAIGDTACLALFGSQAPLRITVPERPSFEAQVGLSSEAWGVTPSLDGVTFVVSVRDRDRVSEVARKEVSPLQNPSDQQWVHISGDLAPFAGRAVTLYLNVESGDSTQGDYAYWGDPKIFGFSR